MLHYYKSVSGKAELEFASSTNGATLSLFPLHRDAKDWNGVDLDADTARKLATDILSEVSR